MKNSPRQTALFMGDAVYFTGKPCPVGHVDVRHTKSGRCKPCASAKRNAARRLRPELNRATVYAWRSANPEKFAEARRRSVRKWTEKHPDRRSKIDVIRRFAQRRAIVLWADQSKIKDIYLLRDALNILEPACWTVDHVVPLIHPLVCGLHNEFNLAVMTRVDNAAKGNRHWPDMPDDILMTIELGEDPNADLF